MNEIQLNEWIQKFPQNLKAKIDLTALAIWNLHQSKFDLGHEDFKNALSYMLRVCSEGSQTHPSAHVISKARLRAPSEAKRHEHMVPVEEVYQTVLRLLGDGQIHSPAELGQFLQRVSLRASILKSEDQKLDRLYKKTMPKEWCVNSNWKNCNPLLRYQVEGVEVVENPSFRDYWKQNQAPRVQNQIKNLQGEMVMEFDWNQVVEWAKRGNPFTWNTENINDMTHTFGVNGYSFHLRNANPRGDYSKYRLEIYANTNLTVSKLSKQAPSSVNSMISTGINLASLKHHNNGNENVYRIYLDLKLIYDQHGAMEDVYKAVENFINQLTIDLK